MKRKTLAAAILAAAISLPVGGQERQDTPGVFPVTLIKTEVVERCVIPANYPLRADAVVETDLTTGEERRYLEITAEDHHGEVCRDEIPALKTALAAMEEAVKAKPKSPAAAIRFTASSGLVITVNYIATNNDKPGIGMWWLHVLRIPAGKSAMFSAGKVGKLREAVEQVSAAL